MNLAQLDSYIADLVDMPEYLREVIYRAHSGRAPCWLALSMRRVNTTIVEVAEELRTHRPDARYAVIKWYWRAQHYGKLWTTFATVEAANKYRDSMFRIDVVYSDLRA